jgi:hypothetical protein
MIDSYIQKFWFAGAIFFFIAILQPDLTHVYVPVGVMLLIISGGPLAKKEHVMQDV